MLQGEFTKSSFSGAAGHCTEARWEGQCVEVRDSKDEAGPVLRFTPAEWSAFEAGVKAGEFALPPGVA